MNKIYSTKERLASFKMWASKELPCSTKGIPLIFTESYGYSVKWPGGKIWKFSDNYKRIYHKKARANSGF